MKYILGCLLLLSSLVYAKDYSFGDTVSVVSGFYKGSDFTIKKFNGTTTDEGNCYRGDAIKIVNFIGIISKDVVICEKHFAQDE